MPKVPTALKNVASFWKKFILNLKENYILPMSGEEIVARIPPDSLRFDAFAQAVKEMQIGETKTFSFHPLDRKFAQDRQRLAELIAVEVHPHFWCDYEVQPRKGIYLLKFTKK